MVNTNQKIVVEKLDDDKHLIDISLYEPNFLKGGDVIKQYIETILGTRKDSVHFEDFGFNLEDYLFDLPDELQAEYLKDTIINVIYDYFPIIDIDLEKTKVEISDNEGKPEYLVTISVISPENVEVKTTLGGNFMAGVKNE